jgi:hypothetical protein
LPLIFSRRARVSSSAKIFEVGLQQIDDWQVGRSLAVRDRERLQHYPFGLRGGFELKQQPRLAHPRISHRGNDLSVTGLGPLRGGLHRIHLTLPSDEFGQPAAGRMLKPRPQRSRAGDLVDVDRFAHPFDSGWTQRLENEVALAELPDVQSSRSNRWALTPASAPGVQSGKSK